MSRRSWSCLLPLAVALVATSGAAEAMEDAVVKSTFAGLPESGRFAIHKAVDIAEVVDMRAVEDPAFLGMPCVGLFRVVSQEKPEVYLRDALEKTLDSLGLRRQPGEDPALLVTARIWRAHAWCRPTPLGAIYFAELNLVFELRSPAGGVLGRAFVLGGAQEKSMSRAAKRNNWWDPILEGAVTEAMGELAGSDGLRVALGSEVAASFTQPSSKATRPEGKVERIDYRKWPVATSNLSKLARVDLSAYSSLELEDFEMGDQDFITKHSASEVKAARGVVSSRIFERLGGLYPGLFAEVTRGTRQVKNDGETGKRLILRGRFRDFEAGSATTRLLLDVAAFGGGRVSYDADVALVDAESGKDLVSFRIDVINLDVNEGELEDLIDWTAADVVRYLSQSKDKNYVSPVLAPHGAQ